MKKVSVALTLTLALIVGACGGGSEEDTGPLTQAEIIDQSEEAVLKVVTRTSGVSVQGKSGQIVGTGSAWVYDAEEGLIVTNAHVVVDGGKFSAGYDASQMTPASLVGVDFPNDIAVLRVNPVLLQNIEDLDLAEESTIDQGDAVYALGYPGNGNADFLAAPFQVTSGSLSAIEGVQITVGYGYFVNENSGLSQDDIYQTDAAINPGNSGGPLVDENGDVVGVVYAGGGENQAGVIPVTKLVDIIPALAEGDSTAWAGFGVSAVSTDAANAFGLDGAMEITQVTKDTPADLAGLGDGIALAAKQPEGFNYLLILSINGQPVGDMEQYVNALENVTSGEQVTFKTAIPFLSPDGKKIILSVLNVKITYP